MRILGLRVGVQKEMAGDLSFSHALLEFRIVCEITVGVRNYFADPLGFHTVWEMVLGMRNFLHGL